MGTEHGVCCEAHAGVKGCQDGGGYVRRDGAKEVDNSGEGTTVTQENVGDLWIVDGSNSVQGSEGLRDTFGSDVGLDEGRLADRYT
jgi:hypothetical protein